MKVMCLNPENQNFTLFLMSIFCAAMEPHTDVAYWFSALVGVAGFSATWAPVLSGVVINLLLLSWVIGAQVTR